MVVDKPKRQISPLRRTKPPLSFRRGTPISPLKPRRPASHDSLRLLLSWDDLGGRTDRLSCKTRIVTSPRLMSFGGFDSGSRNLRFCRMATLPFENGRLGAEMIGCAARISSGSSSGSVVFPESFDVVAGFPSSSSVIFGASPTDSDPSTGIRLSASVTLAEDPVVLRALVDGLSLY